MLSKMGRILEFSDFKNEAEQPSPNQEESFSLDEISDAIDAIGEDLKDCFFVSDISDDAIYISVRLDDSDAKLEASLEDGDELEYFDITWDKSEFRKYLNWELKKVAKPEKTGPKFTIGEIVDAATKVVEAEDCKEYIVNIDTSDVYVVLRETESSHSSKVKIEGSIANADEAKIEDVNQARFKRDLIEKLVKSISGAADYSY